MHKIAPDMACPALRRAGPWASPAGFTRPLAVVAVVLAAVVPPRPAAAQVLVNDLQAVSMQFRTSTQDGIRAHQSQIRARQARVRLAKSPAGLPRLANNLSMSGDQGSIPLRLRDAPVSPARLAGPRMIAPTSVGVVNSFIRGDLHSAADRDTAGSSLTTSDLTAGTDYRITDDMMFGLAAGRLQTGAATGTTLSAYLTLQPVERMLLDMSLSYGVHRARSGATFPIGIPPRATAEGVSRSFSVTLTHPRQVGDWTCAPYSRYERILTEVEARSWPGSALAAAHGLSAVSLGSTAATSWTTPFGAVRPMVMIEVQREIISVASLGTMSSQTVGVVGFAMTTKVSRDMSAFAESRYQSDLAATLDRQMMLGLKLGF